MDIDLPALLEGVLEHWYLVLMIGFFYYGFRGPLPGSRGIWCPNVASVTATVVCLIAYYGLLVGLECLEAGILLYSAGASLDIVDGRLARQYDDIPGNKKKVFATLSN